MVLAGKVRAEVFINEFVCDSQTEWIELYNSSPSAEYLKNYFIDDDTDFADDIGSKKKQANSLNILDIKFPYIEISSFLNNSGDSVVIFNSDGEIVDQYSYQNCPGENISIGRYPDGNGGFLILTTSTKGAANVYSPTPTPSPLPTPTPTSNPTVYVTATAVPTKTPSVIPTKTPSPTAFSTKSASPTPNISNSPTTRYELFPSNTPKILGIKSEEYGEQEKSEQESHLSSGLIVSYILLFVGFTMLVSAPIWFYVSARKAHRDS